MNERTQTWSKFLHDIRDFFYARDYHEVTTPYLVPEGAFEASLDCLQVRGTEASGELHTSPEIAMKAILAETKLPIFQVAKCFRDDPFTPHHRVEFTMLEFYEPFASYELTLKTTRELFSSLATSKLVFNELSVREAFINTVGIDLWALPSRDQLLRAIRATQAIEIAANTTDDWDDLYFKLLIEKVEPSFANNQMDQITVLRDYPVSQAALAAISKVGLPAKGLNQGTFAERFECYGHGIELCNGCTELTDVAELEARIKHEAAKRQRAGKLPHPVSQSLKYSASKMPPSSGVAIGLDRLFLVLRGYPLL